MGTVLKPVMLVVNDPSMALTTCEFCGEVKPLREMHSLKWVYAMPGYNKEATVGQRPFQCADDQHFGCCHEHAFLALIICLFEHMDDSGSYNGKGEDLQHPILAELKAKVKADLAELEQEEWNESNHQRPTPSRVAQQSS